MTRDNWSDGGAQLSDDRVYRYVLWRELNPLHPSKGPESGGPVLWIMLNPSKADATTDDKTISRCIAFSRQWGYRRMEVCNLFAYRATNPKKLKTVRDPVGPENKNVIIHAAVSADRILCAWGVKGGLHGQDAVALKWLAETGRALHCLAYTKDRFPWHPQRLPGEPTPVLFRSGDDGRHQPEERGW